jgi:hypothetical protein
VSSQPIERPPQVAWIYPPDRLYGKAAVRPTGRWLEPTIAVDPQPGGSTQNRAALSLVSDSFQSRDCLGIVSDMFLNTLSNNH